MFPVFLATAVIAVGWTTVLWNFEALNISDPSSTNLDLQTSLAFAFLGAYSFDVQMLVRRFFQGDLRASAYASAVLRIVVVLLLAVTINPVLDASDVDAWSAAVVMFIIGFFPLVGMQALQRLAAAVLRAFVPSLRADYPLSDLDGLTIWYEARLLEEGIEDLQNLSTANLVDVMLHTRVPVGRLVDWVDQSHLLLHLDRSEQGVIEKFSRIFRSGSDKTNQIAAHNELGSPRVGGRYGTRTRHVLRRLGIRTATDLLRAFSAAEMELPEAECPRVRKPLSPR